MPNPNKELIKKSFRKSITSYNDHAKIQSHVCEKLISILTPHIHKSLSIYEFGAGTGILSQEITSHLNPERFLVNDLVDEMKEPISQKLRFANQNIWQFKAFDAETSFPSDQFDLIISASAIQWFDNPMLFFKNISGHINEDGILAFSTYGKDNLIECRTLTGKGLNYPKIEELEQMLSEKFTILHKEEEKLTLEFRNPSEVLLHLKKTGVNAHVGNTWTKSDLKEFVNSYNHLFTLNEGVSLTYHPIYFICKKKESEMTPKIIFISAIDTDAGKTMVTGTIGNYLKKKGLKVITQKIAQTGCQGFSDDIMVHRKLMNEDLNEFDLNRTTCPYVFKFPASPHLAAAMEEQTIEMDVIDNATEKLKNHFDVVLLEGAGGLHVPLSNDYNLIDFIEQRKYPVILVSHGKLGSINHTLMSLEILKRRNIKLLGLIYNNYGSSEKIIKNDTKKLLKYHLNESFPDAQLVNFPELNSTSNEVDFSALFDVL